MYSKNKQKNKKTRKQSKKHFSVQEIMKDKFRLLVDLGFLFINC